MKIDMILVFAIVVGLVAVPYALFILFGSRGEQLVHQHIDLNTITRIVVLEDRISKRIDGKMHDTLEKLSLELISKENVQSIVINFYDSTLDATQNYEMNRVNKWKELIEKQLKLNAKHSKAA